MGGKNSGFRIPKKYFPGLVRDWDREKNDGSRVWHYRGKTFKTLREVYNYDLERLLKKHEESKSGVQV